MYKNNLYTNKSFTASIIETNAKKRNAVGTAAQAVHVHSDGFWWSHLILTFYKHNLLLRSFSISLKASKDILVKN